MEGMQGYRRVNFQPNLHCVLRLWVPENIRTWYDCPFFQD
jgi:hypothetical protein